jgi:hypothetical protein
MTYNQQDTLFLDPIMSHLVINKSIRRTKHGYLATEEMDDDARARLACGKRFRMLHWLENIEYSPGDSVDHIDFNVLNNTCANLRIIPLFVNGLRKKTSNGFYRGVYHSGHKYMSKYGRVTIGVFDTVHTAAAAYNRVLHHVMTHRGHLQWYSEFANPVIANCDSPEIATDILHRAINPPTRRREGGVYHDFWEISRPVNVQQGCAPGVFIVTPLDTVSTCVRCGKGTTVIRSNGWLDGPERFFKCDTCIEMIICDYRVQVGTEDVK